MTNYELLLQVNNKAKENIEQLSVSGGIESLNKCISFSEDLQVWLSFYSEISETPLVKEAQAKCIESIFMCAQGFYNSAILTLRQFFEHMLFAIYLSTNDYKLRLWKAGECDVSWAQLMDKDNGVFGIQFIRIYAKDIGDARSAEFLTIAKNVYRECSEYVHGNHEKLSTLPDSMAYCARSVERYVSYFENIQYAISMAMFIRFRDSLNNSELVRKLESIIAENLGMLQEVQILLSATGEKDDE